MSRLLYDLTDGSNSRFSPFCWRTKLSLAHKQLEFDTIPVTFTEVREILEGKHKVPTLIDNGYLVSDSFQIALYLEETYSNGPSLFSSSAELGTARIVEAWANQITVAILPMIALDICEKLSSSDKEWFRATREQRFGSTLEELRQRRYQGIEAFRATLTPLRTVLSQQSFIGGEVPTFSDFIVFGTFQWPKMMSDFALLTSDDTIGLWHKRCSERYSDQFPELRETNYSLA